MSETKRTYKKMKQKKELKQIILNICFVTFLLLVGLFFGVTFLLSQILIKDDTISSINGYSAQTIISGSMEPTLSVYDVIIVKKQDNYNLGDIITFYVPDEEGKMVCYTHRIVSVGDGCYLTQGDNNQQWDEWTVYRQNVVGTIQARIPGMGKFVLEFSKIPLSTWRIAIIVVFSILAFFIVFDTLKAATTPFTEKELKLLELEKNKKFNFKIRRKILFLKFKRFIQTKIMKRQI